MSSDKSIPELTRDFAYQLSDLLREEVRLARAEAVENVKGLGVGASSIAAGAILAGAAGTLALFALAYGLSSVMPLWAAAAIAAIVGGVLAYLLVASGRRALSGKSLAMPRTTAQVSRDINLIKEHAPS